MAVYLPHMMNSLFNVPIAVHKAKAETICAALAGRLNIQSLADESTRLDERGLRDLAAMARKAPAAPGASIIGNDNGGRPYELTESGIAVIRVWDTLTRTWGVGPYSGATGYDGIWTQLLYAQTDRACKAIWLDINSPGGAVDGLFDLQKGIWDMSERNGGKPIYAYAADYAFSAAYALGAAADKFFMPRTGGVGSIACIMLHADITKALDADGIAVTIFRSHDRKAIGMMGAEPLDQEEIDHIQEQVDQIGQIFVESVAAYRGISKSAVSNTRGWDYMGDQAKAIGLVNDVLTEPEAWAKLERKIAA